MANDGDGVGTARVVVNEIGPLYRPHKLSHPVEVGAVVTHLVWPKAPVTFEVGAAPGASWVAVAGSF